jgi:hypothetical protein
MELFGYKIGGKKSEVQEKSFVPPTEDGAIDTVKGPAHGGGYYATYLDMDGLAKTETETIKRYREISRQADVDSAIEDIVNDSLPNVDREEVVEINVDKIKQPDNIKKAIIEEFNNIIVMLDFQNRGHDYFRRWYVDGRIYFHKVVNPAKKADGISSIRYIDPRKIKKVREVIKDKDPRNNIELITGTNEYYVFNERGIYPVRAVGNATVTNFTSNQALKISKDAICYVGSGLIDLDNNMVLSYLHKAIKPANQLRMMENALVIYRITRAPERRIFYIDVGNLPKTKAEQYLKDIMNRYRNKMVYDADTGELRDDKKHMAMLEDFWLPRRDGGKGTEISTLPGGQNLGQIEDIEYFRKLLYKALNVPLSRLQQESGLNFGKASEISRDELKFTKFLAKLRRKFSQLFDDLLKTQLVLKGIITEEDWDEIQRNLVYKFGEDSYYTESKDQEILRARAELAQVMDGFVGKYVSVKYIQNNVLRLTEEEIKQVQEEMEAERDSSTMNQMDGEAAESDEQNKAAQEEMPEIVPGTSPLKSEKKPEKNKKDK